MGTKRKAIGIIYESHKGMMLPDEGYGLDKHGAIRLRNGRQRLTKGMRAAMRLEDGVCRLEARGEHETVRIR